MAEFMSMIVETVAALMRVAAAWAEALLKGLVVLGCLVFSKKYRSERLNLWKSRPGMKWLDLAMSAVWVVIVAGLPLLLMWPSEKTEGKTVTPVLVRAGTNEDLRIEMRAKQTNDPRTVGTISVKKGGLLRLAETKTLGDLRTQIIESVTVEKPASSGGSANTER